jgi:Cytochrome P460
MHHRWISLLILFVLSIGIAMGYGRLSLSQSSSDNYSQISSVVRSTENGTAVAFPVNYQQQFMQYATVDCPNSRIVRKMYVDRKSLETIAATQTVPVGTVIVMETHSAQAGETGHLVPNRLNNIFIREKRLEPNANPASGQWQSVWYSPSGSLISTDQSSCIGCHVGVRDRDYLFTLPALLTAAQTGQLQHQQTEFGTSVCR